jgi:hypothetical protein
MELEQHTSRISSRIDELVAAEVRGVKPMRFFGTPINIAAPGPYKVVASQGPEQGYVWAVMRITSQDTAEVASRFVARVHDGSDLALPPSANTFDISDVKNLIAAISGGGGAGSNIGFSKGQFLLQGGEFAAVFGWATAATTVAFNGEAIEVPSEMIGKLLI